MMQQTQFYAGDRVRTTTQLGFLPAGSDGTIIRSFVRSDLCSVCFDERAEPRIVSRHDLEIVAAQLAQTAIYTLPTRISGAEIFRTNT